MECLGIFIDPTCWWNSWLKGIQPMMIFVNWMRGWNSQSWRRLTNRLHDLQHSVNLIHVQGLQCARKIVHSQRSPSCPTRKRSNASHQQANLTNAVHSTTFAGWRKSCLQKNHRNEVQQLIEIKEMMLGTSNPFLCNYFSLGRWSKNLGFPAHT